MTSALPALLLILVIQQQPTDRYRQLCRDISNPDSTVSTSALRSVNSITRAEASFFLPLLRDTSAEIRSGAAAALLCVQNRPEQTASALIGALKDTSENVLISVTAALAEVISPADTSAVAPLMMLVNSQSLQDRNSTALYYSVSALKKIGPAAAPALPSIRKLYRNRRIRSDVQAECYDAIQAIRGRKQSP